MQFDDDADLDTSEVQDVRGSRIPGGRATVGGGIAGVIALVVGLSPVSAPTSSASPRTGRTRRRRPPRRGRWRRAV
ncbi:hypothetical protein SCALM49S_03027 [Streptomyces californicus]